MFDSFNRKKILKTIDDLISKKYGSFIELIQLTVQEITDILVIREDRKIEQKLAESGL